MMEILTIILNGLNFAAKNVPWDAILASGILSPLLLIPKRVVKKYFIHQEQVMIIVVGLAGLLVAAGNYLLHVPNQNPGIIAIQGAVLAFMTQPIYFIVVKPLCRKISAIIAVEIAKAAAKDEVHSAAVPPEGLPITAPKVIEDFSH